MPSCPRSYCEDRVVSHSIKADDVSTQGRRSMGYLGIGRCYLCVGEQGMGQVTADREGYYGIPV